MGDLYCCNNTSLFLCENGIFGVRVQERGWLALVPNTLVSFDLSTWGNAVWNDNHSRDSLVHQMPRADFWGSFHNWFSSQLTLWANRFKEKAASCIHIIEECYLQTFWNRSGSTASFLQRGSNANIWNWSYSLSFIEYSHSHYCICYVRPQPYKVK